MNKPLHSTIHRAWPAAALPLLLACLALAPLPAGAVSLPYVEDIERLKASGEWPAVESALHRIHEDSHIQYSESEVLELISADFGLPTEITRQDSVGGNLWANLDGNDVIDERDVLELGWANPSQDQDISRESSITLPFGTVAGNNQPKCLILLVKFPDRAPTDKKNGTGGTTSDGVADVNHDSAWAEDRWFDLTAPANLEDGSVAYHAQQSSYGKLEMAGDCFDQSFGAGGNTVADSDGWILSNCTYADVRSGAKDFDDVLSNAISQVNPHVNFANYDSNNDGYLDGLITIYAGPDDLSDPDSDLWYFRWFNSGLSLLADGIKVESGLWMGEEGHYFVFCHEMGHELGLPDLYDINGDNGTGNQAGCGLWSTMHGWNAAQGVKPPYHDAWSRMHLRWVDPVELPSLSALTSFTVNRATSASPDNTVYKIWRNGAVGREYFLVEYRDSTHHFDDSLPKSGLLIWHVDENRSSGRNTDNSFNPQRIILEQADGLLNPFNTNVPWLSGYNGNDGKDFFDDTSTPNSRDNAGVTTGVVIDPTSTNSGPSMTMDVMNTTGSPPTVSWESPAAGATVSGTVLMDAASSATSKVEYYVNDCLKHVDTAPTFNGFNWNTLTAVNGSTRLRAIAVNSGQSVTVIDRTVTVDNASGSGTSLVFLENFDSYSSAQDNNLLGTWNLREDQMALFFELTNKNVIINGGTGKMLTLRQSTFTAPPNNPTVVDANVGVHVGTDRDFLMTPRLTLAGYNNLQLKYRIASRVPFTGDAILNVQISSDDGASWTKLESLSHYQGSSPPAAWDAGRWDGDPFFGRVVLRTVSLQDYLNEDVYIRFLFSSNGAYGAGFALDDIEVSGDLFSITNVNPNRRQIGQSVTITGNGFGATQGDGKVRFNNGSGGFVEQATVTSWNNTQIVCNVPSGAVSNSPNGVWVYKSGSETNKLGFTVILGAPNLGGVGQL